MGERVVTCMDPDPNTIDKTLTEKFGQIVERVPCHYVLVLLSFAFVQS